MIFPTVFGNLPAQEMLVRDLRLTHDTTLAFFINNHTINSIGDSITTIDCGATNAYNMRQGEPMLPQHVRMLTIPPNAKASIIILDEMWDTVALSDGTKIIAAPGARPKSIEQDEWTVKAASIEAPSTIQMKRLGTMRDQQVIRLTITPFNYDKANNRLLVCRQMKIRLRVTDDKDYTNAILNSQDQPLHYIVVAPEQFRQTLQRFISWKRQEGFIVEELYVTNSDKETIKEQLQQRYDQSTSDNPAPLYLLIVGNTDNIPTWMGKQRISGIGRHFTDFPYTEFTGDSLPDIMAGRWPVADTATLSAVINKTLIYEKYTIADSGTLHRSLLVAGKENIEPGPTVTNGQVNYLKQRISERDPSNDTICFYNPSSASQRDEIYNIMSQGVGIVSYTSHCVAGGWRNPTIVNSDIDSLPENGNLFIAINNCCRANDFANDCFGAHLLCKANGGAVAAIGATNETLWDEDYYWSVGNRQDITSDPAYDSLDPGAFDRLLHTHGEMPSQQATTIGQMLSAGNWAVSRSGSQFDAFYWEIYCLLGDPSLMPYIGTPAATSIEHDTIHCGDSTVAFLGTPYTRIAITNNDTLMGICILDSNGIGTVVCSKPLTGMITITATQQYHRPWQSTIVTEGCPIGISEPIAEHNEIPCLFPSPASDEISITGFNEKTHISILDMTGRIIEELWATKGQLIQYSTSHLRCGVYCFLFESPRQRSVQKLVISR